MLAMFGKWIERVKRNGKTSADAGLLGQYLDAVCAKYVDRYKEMIGLDDKRPGTYDSALDVDAVPEKSVPKTLVVQLKPIIVEFYAITISNRRNPFEFRFVDFVDQMRARIALRQLLPCIHSSVCPKAGGATSADDALPSAMRKCRRFIDSAPLRA